MSRLRIKRVLLVAATLIVCLYLYASSYLAVWWLDGRGTIGRPTTPRLCETAFSPAEWYINSGAMGATTVYRLRLWTWNQARGSPEERSSFTDR